MDAAELPVDPERQPRRQKQALSERERDILVFERQWWAHPGAKDKAIRERFEVSPTRYYQLLNDLIERPAAMEAEPTLVKRLRRLRATRVRARSAKRSTEAP